MGVKTSSDLFKRNDKNVGVVHSGPKAHIRISPDAIVGFRFPTPVRGKSGVSLDIGELKDNGKPAYKKVELTDGVFKIPKSWKTEKKNAYKMAFLKAGFEEFAELATGEVKSKEPPKQYIYFAGHPDNKDDDKVNGNIAVEVDGEEIQLEVVEGIVETEKKEVWEALYAKGYYEAKPPEVIE